MFDVEGTEHGIRVSLGGFLDQDELKDYYEELELRVNRQSGDFHICADHRGVKAMSDGADEQFADHVAMCRDGGPGQSVVNTDQDDDWKQEARE